MPFSDKIAKALSLLLPVKVYTGPSLSFTPEVDTPMVKQRKSIGGAVPGNRESRLSKTYKLRDDGSLFELVGIVQHHGKPSYQLRHVETGKTFNMTKDLVQVLFQI